MSASHKNSLYVFILDPRYNKEPNSGLHSTDLLDFNVKLLGLFLYLLVKSTDKQTPRRYFEVG